VRFPFTKEEERRHASLLSRNLATGGLPGRVMDSAGSEAIVILRRQKGNPLTLRRKATRLAQLTEQISQRASTLLPLA